MVSACRFEYPEITRSFPGNVKPAAKLIGMGSVAVGPNRKRNKPTAYPQIGASAWESGGGDFLIRSDFRLG